MGAATSFSKKKPIETAFVAAGTLAVSALLLHHYGPTISKQVQGLGTGVTAAGLRLGQRGILYKPFPRGIEEMRHPGTYPELRNRVQEKQLGEGENSVTVWEAEGKPVVYFSGNKGHIADIGPEKKARIEARIISLLRRAVGYPQKDAKPPRVRDIRLKFVTALIEGKIEDEPVGLIAVTCRGFGRRGGPDPCEKSIKQDVNTVFEYIVDRGIPSKGLIIIGESLGACAASELGALLTEAGIHPKYMILYDPPASMAKLGEKRIPQDYPVTKMLGIKLPAQMLDSCVLENHHPTVQYVGRLGPETELLLIRSGGDELIDYTHCEAIENVATANGVKAYIITVPGVKHVGVPWDQLADIVLQFGNEVRPTDGRNSLKLPELTA